MHVLETLLGQPPLHGTYMFLSLIAGLGVGHFMFGCVDGTGNKHSVFWFSSIHRVALHIFRSSLSNFPFLWICWFSIDPQLFVMTVSHWSH